MATTVYLPPEVLDSVDQRARALKVSRNRYIVEALKTRLAIEKDPRGWPPGFFDKLRDRAEDTAHVAGVNAMQRAIDRKKPSRKKAIRL